MWDLGSSRQTLGGPVSESKILPLPEAKTQPHLRVSLGTLGPVPGKGADSETGSWGKMLEKRKICIPFSKASKILLLQCLE